MVLMGFRRWRDGAIAPALRFQKKKNNHGRSKDDGQCKQDKDDFIHGGSPGQ